MQFKCLDTGIQYSLAIFELFTNAGGFEGGCVVGVWEGTGNLTQAIRCPSTCTSKHEADLLEWCQLVNITQHCFWLNSNAILLIAWVSRCELRSRPGVKRPFSQKKVDVKCQSNQNLGRTWFQKLSRRVTPYWKWRLKQAGSTLSQNSNNAIFNLTVWRVLKSYLHPYCIVCIVMHTHLYCRPFIVRRKEEVRCRSLQQQINGIGCSWYRIGIVRPLQ